MTREEVIDLAALRRYLESAGVAVRGDLVVERIAARWSTGRYPPSATR
ncbi:hypothetical protein [Nocardia higoensis]|nr:hypothetical protein [Nocardia higoensis]